MKLQGILAGPAVYTTGKHATMPQALAGAAAKPENPGRKTKGTSSNNFF